MKTLRDTTMAICYPTYEMKKTNIIVWVGSKKEWDKVFLNPQDHRLYIRTGFGRFELLDAFNIRKIESI